VQAIIGTKLINKQQNKINPIKTCCFTSRCLDLEFNNLNSLIHKLILMKLPISMVVHPAGNKLLILVRAICTSLKIEAVFLCVKKIHTKTNKNDKA
jgi:hypothetical protein